MTKKKYIVITSIFPPTKSVAEFSLKQDWSLIVVGDKKTPRTWQQKNVKFLSPLSQKKLGLKTYDKLPWNHYSRKMIGYLHAIQNGAEVIADSDDDNIPLNSWGKFAFSGNYAVATKTPYFNIYKAYTNYENVWPRGYPLSQLLTPKKPIIKAQNVKVGIWQFLADQDPDVDAIYRLSDNTPIYFNKRAKPIVLDKECLCPFNSQNTFFSKETFPLLYLPAYVNFRVTDILRSYVAQIVLWNTNLRIGFGTATVIQERNPHNYLKDLESEIPLYTEAEKIIEILKKSVVKNATIPENLMNCYSGLYAAKYVNKNEISLLKAWLEDIKKIL